MARLDQELVSRGLARSRTHAAKLIADGKVSSSGSALTKAAQQVTEETELDVQSHAEDVYVSRAGHKLAGALAAFPAVRDWLARVAAEPGHVPMAFSPATVLAPG